MLYPLSIGNITLDQGPFEGPNGEKGLSDLGIKQKSVVREFPGGYITAQLYGAFPKTISWEGRLYGGTAIDRSFQLERLAENGDQVTFTWAQWIYQGFVDDYKVTVRSFKKIDYEITFRPLYKEGGSGGGVPSSNDLFSGLVANAQDAMMQQSQSPASGATLPGDVQEAISNLNNSLGEAMQNSGGSVPNVPQATASSLLNQISNIQSLLSPIISAVDPVSSSAAADLSGTVGVLSTAFKSNSLQSIVTLSVVNPNLYRLAQQFYQDPALWEVIGNANNISDPLPITDGPIPLVIPVKPETNSAFNSTVVYGSTKT